MSRVPRMPRVLAGGELESGLEGPLGLAEPALGGLDVREDDAAAEDVGGVPEAAQPVGGVGVAAVRGREVSGRPGREPDQGDSGRPGQVVAFRCQLDRPLGVLPSAGGVTPQERERGPVQLDAAGQPGLFVLVDDDEALVGVESVQGLSR